MRNSLVGQTFGRLTVESYFGFQTRANGGRRYLWKCRCICNNIAIVRTELLKATKCGTKSCGCLRREMARERAALARQAYSEQAKRRRMDVS